MKGGVEKDDAEGIRAKGEKRTKKPTTTKEKACARGLNRVVSQTIESKRSK